MKYYQKQKLKQKIFAVIALVIALIMVLSLLTPVFAAAPNTQTVTAVTNTDVAIFLWGSVNSCSTYALPFGQAAPSTEQIRLLPSSLSSICALISHPLGQMIHVYSLNIQRSPPAGPWTPVYPP